MPTFTSFTLLLLTFCYRDVNIRKEGGEGEIIFIYYSELEILFLVFSLVSNLNLKFKFLPLKYTDYNIYNINK